MWIPGGNRVGGLYMKRCLPAIFHTFPGRHGMVIRIINFIEFKGAVLYQLRI